MVEQEQEITKLYPIKSGVLQGSVLHPILYLLLAADLAVSHNITTALFADDKTIVVNNPNANIAALQQHLNDIQELSRLYRIKLNEQNSIQVTFMKRRDTSPTLALNGQTFPQSDNVRYLGIHLYKGLTRKRQF